MNAVHGTEIIFVMKNEVELDDFGKEYIIDPDTKEKIMIETSQDHDSSNVLAKGDSPVKIEC